VEKCQIGQNRCISLVENSREGDKQLNCAKQTHTLCEKEKRKMNCVPLVMSTRKLLLFMRIILCLDVHGLTTHNAFVYKMTATKYLFLSTCRAGRGDSRLESQDPMEADCQVSTWRLPSASEKDNKERKERAAGVKVQGITSPLMRRRAV